MSRPSAPAAKKAFALCLHFVLNCMKWNGFVSCTLVTIGEEYNSNKLIGYNCWEALSCNSGRFSQETSGIIQIAIFHLRSHQHRFWSEVSHSEQTVDVHAGRQDWLWSTLKTSLVTWKWGFGVCKLIQSNSTVWPVIDFVTIVYLDFLCDAEFFVVSED